MPIRIVRLGSPRGEGEGARLGTVRRPPRGVNLDVLALLSRHSTFAVGCYCEDVSRCHRSILADLPAERGAKVIVEDDPRGRLRARGTLPRPHP
jgi:uncharacterized protein YeaO (DUF488 family)